MANTGTTLTINGGEYTVDVDEDMPLLWVLRDELGLTGTKYGCGIGVCGACVVLVDGVAVRSCSYPASKVAGKIETIEGVGNTDMLHIVQEEWINGQVAQCGYCQSGQIVTAVAFLESNLAPTDEHIDEAFHASLCRCGTYPRIREAVKAAAARMKAEKL